MADLNKQQLSTQDFHHNSPGFAGTPRHKFSECRSKIKNSGKVVASSQNIIKQKIIYQAVIIVIDNHIWAKRQRSDHE